MSDHETHIIPVEELSLHIESPDCSCKPEKMQVDSTAEGFAGKTHSLKTTVWIHIPFNTSELIDKLVQI